MPTLAHRIRLDPTPDQIRVFKQAVGTARFVWNWAPAEWNRQYEAGQQSNATALKPPFNAIQYEQFPWLHEVPRDAHAQPFADLAGAWQPYWEALKQRRERPTPSARLRDFLHKTSTRLGRENPAIGSETLSVEGMMQNHHLARAIADQGLRQFFTMLKYKAERYGTQLVAADHWFPSSKLCSTPGCAYLQKDLTWQDREWICPSCGTGHDRDVNAARNLARLATETALPVATAWATKPTNPSRDGIDGKVTPVRDEARPAGYRLAASGQEEVGAHHRTPILRR